MSEKNRTKSDWSYVFFMCCFFLKGNGKLIMLINFCLIFMRGSRVKTKTSGQTKNELMKNKRGKIVSKKAHANGKRVYKKNGLGKWTKAFMQARKNLGIKGFVACKK